MESIWLKKYPARASRYATIQNSLSDLLEESFKNCRPQGVHLHGQGDQLSRADEL